MRHFSIASSSIVILHATSLFFLILFVAIPENKYEWINHESLQPMELPIDSDAQIRMTILFIATMAPTVAAILWSRSALSPNGRLISWVFGGIILAIALAKILI